MRWKQVEFWVPIPSVSLSPRFSLRFLLLLVTGVAVALVFYQPKQSASRTVMLAPAPMGTTIREAQIFEETHLALLQSPYVISAAVQRDDVRELAVLRDRANPTKWIQSHLNVSPSKRTGGAPRLTIATRDGESVELKVIVDAIAEAYKQEILAAPTAMVR